LEKGRTPKARFRPVSKADACEAGMRHGFSMQFKGPLNSPLEKGRTPKEHPPASQAH